MFGDYRTDSHNELEDAYDKGRQAYKDGHMREANPFKRTGGIDLRREEWFHGWDDEKLLQQSGHE